MFAKSNNSIKKRVFKRAWKLAKSLGQKKLTPVILKYSWAYEKAESEANKLYVSQLNIRYDRRTQKCSFIHSKEEIINSLINKIAV